MLLGKALKIMSKYDFHDETVIAFKDFLSILAL